MIAILPVCRPRPEPQLETVTVAITYPVNPAQPHPLDSKTRVFEVNESTLAAAISYYTEVSW